MRRIEKKSEPQHFREWKRIFKAENHREPVYVDLVGSIEYVNLKKELVKEQGYICCYCEKEIGKDTWLTDCDIEHFMPRHPDAGILTKEQCDLCRNLQLAYSNLLASCKGERNDSTDHCNHKKDNWFDFKTCISPADQQYDALFGFRLSGKIFSLGNGRSGLDMMKHLNLDTYILQEQRKKAYEAVVEAEFDEDELLDDESYIYDTIKYYEQKHDGRFMPFCSMITYCMKHYL